MPSFLLRGRHLSFDDAKFNFRISLKNFGSQTSTSNNILHTTWPLMAGVDFLHLENPPTWAGVEPATLDADDLRQTNYATQSPLAEL
ncbi:hypothetical protein TNCV_1706241 [Trichonephila clavipes]|nr:hypothetical protein TNCV_1706241 [Trichonephila clavipes]